MTKADKKLGKVKPKYTPLKSEVSNRGKRKPKKDKRPWQEKYHVCPFCSSPLQKIDKTKEWWYIKFEPGKVYGLMVDNMETVCRVCGASEVPDSCPSCHRDTWFKPDDKTCTTGEYKHDKHGCGFSGRLKLTKEKK